MKAVKKRTIASALIIIYALCALAATAFARDALAPGAGMVSVDAAVYADESCAGSSVAILPGLTEAEILETSPGAVRVAYYDPATLLRQTGWIPDDGSVISLRRHLTPGPYYQNIHPDADVLSEPRADAVLLGRLAADANVEIIESTSDWVRVVFITPSRRRAAGWVARPYIVPRREPIAPVPSSIESDIAEPSPSPLVTLIAVTPDSIAATPEPIPIDAEPAAPAVPHTVTLNAPDPDKPTRMTSRPDRYAMSYGDYYNGVTGEYLGYDPAGFVKARVGSAEGYWPVEYVWVDAPRGMIPSAIPSAQVAQMGTRLNMRSHPNTNAEVLAQYITDQPLEILAVRDGWMQVRVDDLIGYVASAYVVKMVNRYVDPNTIPVNPPFDGAFSQPVDRTPAPAPNSTAFASVPPTPQASPAPVSARPPEPPAPLPQYAVVNPVGEERLSLLERPDGAARVLCQYNKGVIVTIDAAYDAVYVRVHIGLTDGYMPLDSLDTENVPDGAPGVYGESLPRARLKRGDDAQSATLYAAPSEYADRLGTCPPGQTAVILGVTSAWSHVYTGGRIGYVRTARLDYADPE
ncbi:MAG: SH3 domain-containing protein [Oscillospiraceae bacterium]|jgi:SH3-like domain-containing protein|nr:SH3 domain-containing protein [Oscillospiraceae bacterium]